MVAPAFLNFGQWRGKGWSGLSQRLEKKKERKEDYLASNFPLTLSYCLQNTNSFVDSTYFKRKTSYTYLIVSSDSISIIIFFQSKLL